MPPPPPPPPPPVNYVIIGLYTVLSPVRCRVITTKLPYHQWAHGKTLQWNSNRSTKVYNLKCICKDVCKVVAILSRPQCVQIQIHTMPSMNYLVVIMSYYFTFHIKTLYRASDDNVNTATARMHDSKHSSRKPYWNRSNLIVSFLRNCL